MDRNIYIDNMNLDEALELWEHRLSAAGCLTPMDPEIIAVDQALGRVVRSTQDKGNALLIDTRYRQTQYRQLLPPWWTYRHWPPPRLE